ncbi:MAG: GNAT family N-acetyltransferase [Acetobacteraceae bacterium]
MIRVRRAVPDDAAGIAAVHVGAWRSAYAGLLPEDFLTGLSLPRQAMMYQAGIVAGRVACVAEDSDRIIGFSTAGRARAALADGEIETLYVLDDWRERGIGRSLLQSSARRLVRAGCRSAFVWVLRDNPSRWFYQHLGGRQAAESMVHVAGAAIPQTAYVWDPIDLLLTTPAKS